MVYVSQRIPITTTAELPEVSEWLDSVVAKLPDSEAAQVRKAVEFAMPLYGDRKLSNGESLAAHTMGVASILSSMSMDYETVTASVLLGVPGVMPDYGEAVRTRFSEDIAALVEGVAQMGQIETQTKGGEGETAADKAAQAEGLRKMLLAMVSDIRVVIIKLAERTQVMRYISGANVTVGADMARETLDIFAPLASRIGVWQLKWELEDLSFRLMEPELYRKIARMLDERRVDREQYISDVINTLKDELARAGIQAEVSGRPKHIYSIYKKMRRKQVGIDEIYDTRAVRVMVQDVKDCYAALGVVHNLWQPIPKEFDDYIAKPKSNDYRSLHTGVIGPEGKGLEVQIRTFDMHQHAELGVAAHWKYKEGGRHDSQYGKKIAWLRQILDWKDEVADAEELAEQFKTALFQDTVYVLTPQGKVIDLPKGSTPVDFAYHVHTDLGHRCRGAKVDGAIVPLNYALRNAQRVEIIAAKQGGPSRDWLNTELGYLKSPRARAKVRHWFKSQEHDATVAQGRAMVERELQRHGLTSMKLETFAEKFKHSKVDEFLIAVARGEINHRQLGLALQEETQNSPVLEPEKPLVRKSLAGPEPGGVLVLGVDKLLTVLAKCCKPAPPDPIVGFITRGRGVTIHRQGCPNLSRLSADSGERLVSVNWGTHDGGSFAVDIVVEATDRQGLLRDISEVLSREKINVTAANTQSRDLRARMSFTVEITGIDQLKRALALIRDVRGVVSARRT